MIINLFHSNINGIKPASIMPISDDMTVRDLERDLDNARNVLEVISSKNVKKFLVALKPKYLEIYSDLHNRIPEFHICELAFNKEQIKNIIMSYGTEIAQFKKIYQKYIERTIDKISRILWQKEPTPLTILDYYFTWFPTIA